MDRVLKDTKIAVCGVACEVCPRMQKGTCPNGPDGCTPKDNQVCKICKCAFDKGQRYCFTCPEFPCELTKQGPITYGYCTYISS